MIRKPKQITVSPAHSGTVVIIICDDNTIWKAFLYGDPKIYPPKWEQVGDINSFNPEKKQ